MKKAIIYYTCNEHDPEIDELCRDHLSKINLPIVTVSLNKNLDFGDKTIRLDGERSPLTMHKQILAGLLVCESDTVFLAESDVIYHPSHFEFNPKRDDVFYFNTNVWKLRWKDGHCVRTDNSQQLSGMSGSRKLLINFFDKRVKEIEEKGFDRHYEPQTDKRENYESQIPNVCIRHDKNITMSKWSVKDYRNKKYAKGWREISVEELPGWSLESLFIKRSNRFP